MITQNVDDLHHRAGTQNLLKLHGSLFQTKCMKCGDVADNFDSPICPALKDKGYVCRVPHVADVGVIFDNSIVKYLSIGMDYIVLLIQTQKMRESLKRIFPGVKSAAGCLDRVSSGLAKL